MTVCCEGMIAAARQAHRGRVPELAAIAADLKARPGSELPNEWIEALIREAEHRGIPARWLPGTDLIELGQGTRLKRLDASRPLGPVPAWLDHAFPVVQSTLSEAGPPIEPMSVLRGPRAALKFATRSGYPVVAHALGGGGWQRLYRAENAASLILKDALVPRALRPYVLSGDPHGQVSEVLVWNGVGIDTDGVPGTVSEYKDHRTDDRSRNVASQAASILGLKTGRIRVSQGGRDDAVGGGHRVAAVTGRLSMAADISGRPEVGARLARDVMSRVYPGGSSGRVLSVAITGTNGKTSTTRLAAHVLQAGGFRVGQKSTIDLRAGQNVLAQGDVAATTAARRLSRRPEVEVMVLETPRGGLLNRGVPCDPLDVGVILNVEDDHLGSGGVVTLGDLATVKGLVAAAVQSNGHVILNAADQHVVSMRHHVKGHITWLWPHDGALPEDVEGHMRRGGKAIMVRHGMIVLVAGRAEEVVCEAVDTSLTFRGRASFMLANVLAAVAVGHALGVSVSKIRSAITDSHALCDTIPGRLNVFNVNGAIVIVDQAHNGHAVQSVLAFSHVFAARRRVAVVAVAGDRTDEEIGRMGRLVGAAVDSVIVREQQHLRGRARGDVAGLLVGGVAESGLDPARIRIILGEEDAIGTVLHEIEPGDVVVALATGDVASVVDQVRSSGAVPFEAPVRVG